MATKHLTIGTRGSALALKQTSITLDALKAADPTLTIDVRVIQTQGDVNQQPIPLDTIGKGWFTQEIENALLKREIDLAVHSLKDMADEMPDELSIGAYLPREDARDVLVTKDSASLETLRPGAIVGTDSARRQVQMRALRPDVQMMSMRGNVPTRLEKLSKENYDAIILAAAGLRRLGLEHKVTRYFEPEEMVPAPGQGILALQARSGDDGLRELLALINDAETAHIAHIERSFSRAMGGGCKSPTGAYARREGNECVLIAMTHTEGHILHDTMRALWNESDDLGKLLAQKLQSATPAYAHF